MPLDPTEKPVPARVKRVLEMEARAKAQGELLPASDSNQPPPATKTPKVSTLPAPRSPKKSKAVVQRDFFAPMLYDVGARDSRGVMDVAVFRLSKTEKRANSVIRYQLPDGHVQVSSGAYGMASVWDYDIVLMAVSHLTEAMNRFRSGHGEKPGQVFRPHIADVLSFCRKNNGGNQKDAVLDALNRLATTYVSIERMKNLGGVDKLVTEGENLIGPSRVISNPKTKKVEFVEIKLADWMYQEITSGTKPDVLTVDPDYFLIPTGVGRFIYRLARKAAGKDMATWSFALLHDRSGSKGPLKEFSRILREIIKTNDLPEYDIAEEEGLTGPLLRMVHRGNIEKWKANPAPADPGEQQ